MQADKQQQQPWSLYIHAKTKNLDFKFRVTKILPTWKIHRFSFMLKLHRIFLKVKSDHGISVSMKRQQGRTWKSKVLRVLKKLRSGRIKNQSVSVKKRSNLHNPEIQFSESVSMSSLLVGVLALVSQTISKRIEKEIIIHCSIVFYFIDLLFKRFMKREVNKVLVLLIAVTFACLVLFDLNNYLNYYEEYVSEYVWKIWNYAASSGCLYSFSQVIFSRFRRCLEGS